MNLEEIATKEDLKQLSQEIASLMQRYGDMIRVPQVCESEKAREILGGFSGPVSDGFLQELKRKKIINPKKIGGKWLFNVKELVRVLPQDPKEK